MSSFADMLPQERERLTGLLVSIDAKVKELQLEAAVYERELAALDAYERTKAGKGGITVPTPSSRNSRRETILSMIANAGRGMTRAALIEELGIKGDKSQEGSISNALTVMKKQGKVRLQGGIYTAVAA